MGTNGKSKIYSFKDLIVWKKSHELTLEIYLITKLYPRFEEFGLANQSRRSAYSVPSTIAEGFKRKSNKDSCHFYNIAQGSLEELRYQLLLAKDLKYIADEKYVQLEKKAEEISKLLYSWIRTQID